MNEISKEEKEYMSHIRKTLIDAKLHLAQLEEDRIELETMMEDVLDNYTKFRNNLDSHLIATDKIIYRLQYLENPTPPMKSKQKWYLRGKRLYDE